MAPIALGALAAFTCLWDLTSSGWANTYYSAAAQAAAQSWSAMFFGSIDAAGFITVDKPPVSLWAMGLSVRVFGLSPLAVLLPGMLANFLVRG
ncbi:MAG: glycosyl transferase, partial [Chloroflexota bacterium]